MMAITTNVNYPDVLPYPSREGYTASTVPTFIRTNLASGRARQRRLFSSVPTMFKVTWVLRSDGEAAAFEAWFRDVLLDGAEWFNAPMKTPIGVKKYVCRFSEMYDGPNIFGACAWKVSATLEMFERPLFDVGWGQFPEFIASSDIIDIAMNREWPEA